jgi:glycosyltransferase involved in cell wall biosynthesis
VAAELRRRAWEVDVVHCVTADDPEPVSHGPAGERLLGLRSRIIASRLPMPLPGRANAEVMRRVRASAYDFSLIQSHLFVSNLLAARAVGRAHRSGGSSVWLNHGSGHIPAGSPVTDRVVTAYEHVLARGLRTMVPVTAGVSEEAAAWLAHFSVHTTASVGNAVSEVRPPRDGRREGPLRVLYVGRLEPGKGPMEAIRLVEQLPPSVEVELTLCGDGTLAADVERLARASSRRVRTTGALPHSQIQGHVADADVFLYPSTYPEGFPTVLLEAGAAGCAVLIYPVGGARELLQDGGGWCVEDEREAAARLEALAHRPVDATAAGEVLRRTVRSKYTWQPVVDRLLRLGGVNE